MAKHARETHLEKEKLKSKEVQVKFIKEASIFDQIDVESLALFREMKA